MAVDIPLTPQPSKQLPSSPPGSPFTPSSTPPCPPLTPPNSASHAPPHCSSSSFIAFCSSSYLIAFCSSSYLIAFCSSSSFIAFCSYSSSSVAFSSLSSRAFKRRLSSCSRQISSFASRQWCMTPQVGATVDSALGLGPSCESTAFSFPGSLQEIRRSSQSRSDTAVVELPLTPPPSPQLPPCAPVPPPTPTTAPSPAPLHCRVSSVAHDIIPMRPSSPPAVLVAILTPPPAAPPSPTPSNALPPSLASGEVLPSRRTTPQLPATPSSKRCCMSPADAAAVVNLVAMLMFSTESGSSRKLCEGEATLGETKRSSKLKVPTIDN
ncbi:uncharacterized protein LOC134763711 [Penaeus indicus]|uniref:uncharacterized protein LOC134763711 n=1 Tax=Penaeus indicus TaxID=29960 RepID=UPI00300CF9DC